MDRIPWGENINYFPQDSSMPFDLDALRNLLAEIELVNGEQNPHKDLFYAFHYVKSRIRSSNLCSSSKDKIHLPLKRANDLLGDFHHEKPTTVEKYHPLLEMDSFLSRECQVKSKDLSIEPEAQD